MDDTFLRRAAGAAGYRLANDRLTEAAIEQPEHAANWIAAAARYTATGRIQRLLTDAAQQLRDRLTGRPPTRFRADAGALAAVCDLLADIDEALRDLGRHALDFAHLGRPPLIDDPAATALPAALAGRQEAVGGDEPAARAQHVTGGSPLPPGRRRPRRSRR
ncbi:hypothetical protein EDC02_7781 [Micromonospora sp. Llam0]|uniref:hypothetical protein n=1 Tax=Micromonospora sp. Llam0 TaxID=2485143 RepID=UPI000F494DAE|nr:hypothetical protein [Micromonospora sp. Llam0]ROO52837.1 hypothetical protein EDC02_7781 [Micromonospora sp. Llam0]